MIMKTELTEFMKKLKANKKNLSGQQFRTIKGQAFAGDIAGAEKGLHKLLERRFGEWERQQQRCSWWRYPN